MSIKRESWKQIPSYPDYAVSTRGRLKRLTAKRGTYVGRIIVSSGITPNGYPFIGLRKNGRRTSLYVHRLVSEAFHGICPKGKQVNHINGIKTDCRADNLQYVTPSENDRHAYSIGLKTPTRVCKLTPDEVRYIRSVPRTTGSGIFLAEDLHVSPSLISMIRRYTIWKHLH